MTSLRKIVIVPYNPRWPEMYQQEAAKISAVFGDLLLSIHHVGSTAVPGLSAKPIIDMMPVVRDIELVDQFNPAMIEAGYKPFGEHGITGRRYFRKGSNLHRTHHIHVYGSDNPEIAHHLDFRDYLIAHPQAAQQYAAIKIKASKQFPHDINGYMDTKTPFISQTIQQACQWRAEQKETF